MRPLKSVCVYCGSAGKVSASHKTAARDFGGLLAARGIELVYGGGHIGLMGIAADAALANGGAVIGVIPQFLADYEVAHDGCTELIVTENMHERKRIMAERADAFVVLPGGLGTLDEAFETLTWKQLGLHSKPIVFLNIDAYWAPFMRLIDHQVAEKYVRSTHAGLFETVDSVEAVLPAILRTIDSPARLVSDKI